MSTIRVRSQESLSVFFIFVSVLFGVGNVFPSQASASDNLMELPLSGEILFSGDPILDKLLQIASYNNPSISVAIERVNQSQADVRGAAAEFSPSITGGLDARWNKDAPTTSRADPETGEISNVPSGYRNSYVASLSFIQTVFAGGSLVANKRAADLALSAVRAESVRTYQSVLNSTRVSYYDSLRVLAQLQVANESLNLSKEHLKQTEALQKGGLVPMGDVLRVKVSVSQAELDRIGAENTLDVNWVALERIVGVSLPRSEILKPVSGDRTQDLEPPVYDLPPDVAKRALEQRAEIRAYSYYKERADQLAKSAAGQYFPRVNLSGQANNTDGSFWPNHDDTWYIQMSLQWTLFDSGRIASQVEKSKASAREPLHQLDDLTSQVRQEVVQAELNLRSALTRLDVAEDQIKTAEEDYRIALRRYDAQVGTNLDVLDARVALTDSRTEYVNAVYDIAIAQSSLIFAIGEDLPPRELFKGGHASEAALEAIEERAIPSGSR